MESCIDNINKQKSVVSQDNAARLVDVPKGEKCVVIRIKKKGSVTKRLVEMGISRGAVIEIERVAPLGDPIEVKVKGYHLSIRKEEAKNIEVSQRD
jgi:DtxR family Mn-dependent transcriptional regulator